jgi:hypothetical protein
VDQIRSDLTSGTSDEKHECMGYDKSCVGANADANHGDQMLEYQHDVYNMDSSSYISSLS